MTYLIYLQILLISYNQNILESDSVYKTIQIMIPCNWNAVIDKNFIDINKHDKRSLPYCFQETLVVLFIGL